jgi:hypothetical protein
VTATHHTAFAAMALILVAVAAGAWFLPRREQQHPLSAGGPDGSQ